MKFLTNQQNLQLHFDALCRSITFSNEIIQTQKQGIGKIFIEFTNSSSLYKYRSINNFTTLSISESFIQSSDEVLKAVLQNTLLKRTTTANYLYHELLHKHHGIRWMNGKCMIHTPEFKRSERKFRQFEEVEALLKGMTLKSVQSLKN